MEEVRLSPNIVHKCLIIIIKIIKMTNVDKIKAIFLDYAQGIEWLEISKDELDIIAKRIEVEVMGISDDNEFVTLVDLNKNK
jgi:hypothetical protein